MTVGKIIADGAYDSNAVFNVLRQWHLPCIKVRRRLNLKKQIIYLENVLVISQKKNNLQERKDSVSYGERWIAETVSLV